MKLRNYLSHAIDVAKVTLHCLWKLPKNLKGEPHFEMTITYQPSGKKETFCVCGYNVKDDV